MTKIILLGASGSVGRQVIQVIKDHFENFQLVGASVNTNTDFLNDLIKEFSSIKCVCASKEVLDKVEFDNKTSSLEELLAFDKQALVVNAIRGIEALKPTIAALHNSQDIAMANKEAIVMAGDLLIDELKNYAHVNIYPLDSEHNAIFQCLNGERMIDVDKLILTCSGGPYLNTPIKELEKIKPDQAIKHPRWNMGKHISVDSATLFNKGLEIIEAHYLFGIDYSKIEVLIHPESIIHSMVEFNDGNIKALLSYTSMELPILYGISKGSRMYVNDKKIDLAEIKTLNFQKVDNEKFKSIDLAYKVGQMGGSAPTIYCVANSIAVEYFLKRKIKFTDIYKVVKNMVYSIQKEYNYDFNKLYKIIDDTKKATINYIENLLKGER